MSTIQQRNNAVLQRVFLEVVRQFMFHGDLNDCRRSARHLSECFTACGMENEVVALCRGNGYRVVCDNGKMVDYQTDGQL